MDGASEAAIAKVFAEIRLKNSISLIVRALWQVQEVESYAPSKFQPPTTLGDHQNVEKTIWEKNIFLDFGNQFFVIFPGFWRESTISSVKINFLVKFCSRYTYSEVCTTKNCEQNDLCCKNLISVSSIRARPNLFLWYM